MDSSRNDRIEDSIEVSKEDADSEDADADEDGDDSVVDRIDSVG